MSRRALPEHQKYYVYAFVRESGIPYYIGRGCRYRAWDGKNRVVQPPKNRDRIKVVKEFLSLEEANKLECALIEFWGRRDTSPGGVLANMQDGGLGGSPGRKMPEAQREIMRQAHLGRKQDEEWIRRRTAHKKGKPHTQDHAAHLKEAIRSQHRVHWYHDDLGLYFYGTSTELSEQCSSLFYDYAAPGDRKLRKGCSLDRNNLRLAWLGERGPYKGWTRDFTQHPLDSPEGRSL